MVFAADIYPAQDFSLSGTEMVGSSAQGLACSAKLTACSHMLNKLTDCPLGFRAVSALLTIFCITINELCREQSAF